MSDGPESRKGVIEKGKRMPDNRPSSVSRIAMSRTVRTVNTSEGKKAVQFTTLPSDTILLVEDEYSVTIHRNGKDANRRLVETGRNIEAGLLGFVSPGSEDGAKAQKEFVVVQVDREEVKEDEDPTTQGSMADGQRMTVEGEASLVDEFVQTHPDLFPVVPGAE